MRILLSSDDFPHTFEKAIDICSQLLNIPKDQILSKSAKRNITDIKKLIVYKFYSLKEFNCGHSNVVYWYNKAKELYSSDPIFRSNYNIFSTELDSYIKNSKKS